MDLTILIEPTDSNGFRAICGQPLHLETAAETREQAVAQMRELIEGRLAGGAEVVQVKVGEETHPLASYIGMWSNDQGLQEWKTAIDDYRNANDGSAR